MILSAFERVVSMMSAEKIDAAPILASGPTDAEKPAQWRRYKINT